MTDVPTSDGAICGTDLMGAIDPAVALTNTARLNPTVYRDMMEASKSDAPRLQSFTAGDEWNFYTLNRVTQSFDQVTGVVVWEGKHARIWVDLADMNDATRWKAIQATIPAMAKALDTLTSSTSRNPAQGMIQNNNDVFGPTPGRFAAEWDYKTNFLYTDIKDGFAGTGGYVAGYFYAVDQTDEPSSNRMNILYIDSREGISGGVSALAGTIAHEFQHLIHYGTNSRSQVLYNEGCSEVASILNGYRSRSGNQFLNNTNTDLFSWNYNNANLVLNDYARAMMLMWYLNEQYGEPFLTKFAATTTSGVNRIGTALTAIGRTETWQDALKGFAVANYLQTYAADPRYGYKTRLSSAAAKAARTFTGRGFPADTSMTLQPYGSSYLVFSKPQGVVNLRFTSPSNSKYGVMAMVTRNGSTQVTELALNTDYALGEDGVYDKIVVALVSLGSSVQTAKIAAQFTEASGTPSSSREEQSRGVSSLALLGNSPNPFSGLTSIRFSTAVPGPVMLELFDATGMKVRTIVDGDRYEAGEHALELDAHGLPNGYYIVRLVQGGSFATLPIAVVE